MLIAFDHRGLTKALVAIVLGTIGVTGSSSSSAEDSLPPITVKSRLSSKPWLMPGHFGRPKWGQPWPDKPGESLYGEVTEISISYLTDREKLLAYLPEPFDIEGPPILTVSCSSNRKITWLAGGAYSICAVRVKATYRGEVDTITGNYSLVVWEDLTDPILTGRELQGVPKVFGDIEEPSSFNGIWRSRLSNRGKTILELQAEGLTQLEGETLSQYGQKVAKGSMLGWKYIPNETGSAPLVSYATDFPVSTNVVEAWSATCKLTWHSLLWQENPTQAHIVNALSELPVAEIVSCNVTKSSKVLHSGSVRRLR